MPRPLLAAVAAIVAALVTARVLPAVLVLDLLFRGEAAARGRWRFLGGEEPVDLLVFLLLFVVLADAVAAYAAVIVGVGAFLLLLPLL
jgi:hypothetical protein